MDRVVLDASALLAALKNEPGADIVRTNLPGAAMSAVNLAEVAGVLTRGGVPGDVAESILRRLPIEIIPLDQNQAFRIGLSMGDPAARHLSLGDRACLSLALELRRTAMTTDRLWLRHSLGASVTLIR